MSDYDYEVHCPGCGWHGDESMLWRQIERNGEEYEIIAEFCPLCVRLLR